MMSERDKEQLAKRIMKALLKSTQLMTVDHIFKAVPNIDSRNHVLFALRLMATVRGEELIKGKLHYKLNDGVKYYGVTKEITHTDTTDEERLNAFICSVSVAIKSPETLSRFNVEALKDLKEKLETGVLCL